jgi:hypothetical protein
LTVFGKRNKPEVSEIKIHTEVSNSDCSFDQTTEESTTGGKAAIQQVEFLARRRRILKGLVATVPAIVTLRSGAALANTSIGSTCIAEHSAGQTRTSLSGNRCLDGTTTPVNPGWNYQLESYISGGADPNLDGDGDGDSYCLLYVNSGGTLATANQGGGGAANWYGGDTSFTSLPSADFYAVSTSCWTSFY